MMPEVSYKGGSVLSQMPSLLEKPAARAPLKRDAAADDVNQSVLSVTLSRSTAASLEIDRFDQRPRPAPLVASGNR
jgi:hypothetical protein